MPGLEQSYRLLSPLFHLIVRHPFLCATAAEPGAGRGTPLFRTEGMACHRDLRNQCIHKSAAKSYQKRQISRVEVFRLRLRLHVHVSGGWAFGSVNPSSTGSTHSQAVLSSKYSSMNGRQMTQQACSGWTKPKRVQSGRMNSTNCNTRRMPPACIGCRAFRAHHS